MGKNMVQPDMPQMTM